MTIAARELRLEDGDAVRALREAAGMSLPSEAQWKNLHAANPARAELPEAPLGWVLSATDRIVGCFMNIPLLFWFRGRRLRTAATSGWIVLPEHRSSSILLLGRYFSQRGVDLLLNASANPSSSQAFEAFRGKPVPGASRVLLLWIAKPSAAAEALLHGRSPALRALGVASLRAAERAARALLGRRARHGVAVLDAPDERFDALFTRVREASPHCLQDRSAATLRWICEGQPGGARFLVLERAGALVAYLALVRRDDRGLTRYRIVDAQSVADDPDTLGQLVGAALALAFDEGVAVVDTYGFCAAKRRALARHLPLRRSLAQWPFYFRTADATLGAALAEAGAWDPCPIEGDGVLGSFAETHRARP